MRQATSSASHARQHRRVYDAVKRLFDFLIGTALAVVLTLPALVIAFRIRRSSPGSVLFRQIRSGRYGRPFRVYKFRTMYADAEKHGPQLTSCDDARVTPLGRFLRNTKIDEFPQLLNVIRGDMNLVGPRPQVPRFARRFAPEYRDTIFSARPGITGPAQLFFHEEEEMLAGIEDRETYYVRSLLPTKCRIDAEYVERASLLYDLQIVCRTTGILIRSMDRRLLRLWTRAAIATDVAVHCDD